MDGPTPTPGSSRPPFDPFERLGNDPYLPSGTHLTLLLIDQYLVPRGARAVAGEVVGYAVRNREWINVRLERMTTWLHGHPMEEIEVLEPEVRSTFAVRLRGSLRQTLEYIQDPGANGRQWIRARELRSRTCSRCGAGVAGHIHCTECGLRVSMGAEGPRPTRRPPAGASRCPACWGSDGSRGAYCGLCGFDRTLARRVASTAPASFRFLLAQGGHRFGTFEGEVEVARLERRYLDGGVQVFMRVGRIRPVGPHRPAVDPPPEEFRTILSVSETPERFLAAVDGGEAVRVSEPFRRCSACARSSSNTTPIVRGRHCSLCGRRSRMAMDPGYDGRLHAPGRLRIQAHSCGTRYVEGGHQFCPGCGEGLEAFEPGGGRLARLR